jgi:hypothetical protein
MDIYDGDIGEEQETIILEPLDEPAEIPLPVPVTPERHPVPA